MSIGIIIFAATTIILDILYYAKASVRGIVLFVWVLCLIALIGAIINEAVTGDPSTTLLCTTVAFILQAILYLFATKDL